VNPAADASGMLKPTLPNQSSSRVSTLLGIGRLTIYGSFLNLKETEMEHTGAEKAKPGSLMEEGLTEDMEQREQGRRTSERNERQDLNQGMNTGTHSSSYRGLDWGPSYRIKSRIERPHPIKEQIAARAYELYLERGRGEGQELQDWLLAEKELKHEAMQANWGTRSRE